MDVFFHYLILTTSIVLYIFIKIFHKGLGVSIDPKNRAKTRILAIWLKWLELDPNFRVRPEKNKTSFII